MIAIQKLDDQSQQLSEIRALLMREQAAAGGGEHDDAEPESEEDSLFRAIQKGADLARGAPVPLPDFIAGIENVFFSGDDISTRHREALNLALDANHDAEARERRGKDKASVPLSSRDGFDAIDGTVSRDGWDCVARSPARPPARPRARAAAATRQVSKPEFGKFYRKWKRSGVAMEAYLDRLLPEAIQVAVPVWVVPVVGNGTFWSSRNNDRMEVRAACDDRCATSSTGRCALRCASGTGVTADVPRCPTLADDDAPRWHH